MTDEAVTAFDEDAESNAKPLAPLITTTRAGTAATRRYCCTNDQPSMIGIRRSRRMSAGSWTFTSSRAAAPCRADATA